MAVAELIFESVKSLLEPMAVEVLHYAQYLKARCQDQAELLDLTLAQQTTMNHVWDNPDDEVWNDVPSL